jgi:hypothetical protein
MTTFILVFFFGAFLPYINLQYQRENSLSDRVLEDLARLDWLTLQQENLSKSIQNYLDTPTRAAISDYQRLDEYFRRLDLFRSQAIASSSNIPATQLEALIPTFFVCNQQVHTNISDWVTCNANFVADGINKKIINRYQPIARQIEPLVNKTSENLNVFSELVEPLISENNNEIISRLPSSIDRESWRESISNSLGLMKSLEANSKSVLNFVSYNKSAASFAWEVLQNPSAFRLAYTDEHRKNFNKILNLLNQSKNEIKNKIEALSEKFEEVEVPVLGKVPLGLTNAVMIYPTAVGLGSLICSYYLGQTIMKRKILQNQFNANDKDMHDLYPLWVDPLEENKLIRYGKLVLFLLLPYLILVATNYILASRPVIAGSIFGLNEGSILVASLVAGYILATISTFILLLRTTKGSYNKYFLGM